MSRFFSLVVLDC